MLYLQFLRKYFGGGMIAYNRSVVSPGVSSFLRLPQYSWNNVEFGIKHTYCHNPLHTSWTFKFISVLNSCNNMTVTVLLIWSFVKDYKKKYIPLENLGKVSASFLSKNNNQNFNSLDIQTEEPAILFNYWYNFQ